MAEAIGIFASVAGLVALSIHVSKQIYIVATDLKDAPKSIKALNAEIGGLASVLAHIKAVMQEDFGSRYPFDDGSARYLRPVLDSCEETFHKIQKKLEPYKNGNGNSKESLRKSLRFLFEEKEIEKFKQSLATHKQTLTVTSILLVQKSAKKTLHNTHEILRDTLEIRSLVDTLIKEVKSQQLSASPELPRDTETAITQYIKRAKTFLNSESSVTDDTVVVDSFVDEEDTETLEERNVNDLPEVPVALATDNLIDGRGKETLLEQQSSDLPVALFSAVTDDLINEGTTDTSHEQNEKDLPKVPSSPGTENFINKGNKSTVIEGKYSDLPEVLVRPITEDLIRGGNRVDEENRVDERSKIEEGNEIHEENKADGGNKIHEESKVDGENKIHEESKVDERNKIHEESKVDERNEIDGENKIHDKKAANIANKSDEENKVDEGNKFDAGNKVNEGHKVDEENKIDEKTAVDGYKVDGGNKISLEEPRNKASSELPDNPTTDESQPGPQNPSKLIKVSQEVEEKSKRALIVAAANGNLKMATFLLDLISNVNMVDERLGTALQASIANGHDAVAQKLLKHQADPNIHGSGLQLAPLCLAIQKGKNDLAKLLLSHGATATTLTGYRGSTALELALSLGNKEMFYLLLEKGADPNIQGHLNCYYPIQTAVARKDMQAIKALAAKGANLNHRQIGSLPPLSMAIKANDFEIFTLLLHLGADLHTPGDRSDGTPLNVSIWSDKSPMMQELLLRGADPNIAGDLNALFPIQTAVQKKNVIAIKALAAKGANLNARQVLSQPPLCMAIKANDRDLFDLLLSLGADVNTAGDRADGTPLNYTLRCYGGGGGGGGGGGDNDNQTLDFLTLLLSHAADPNEQGDLNAQRPLQTAVALKNKAAVALLLQHGADPELGTGLCPSPLDMAVKSDDADLYMMLVMGAGAK